MKHSERTDFRYEAWDLDSLIVIDQEVTLLLLTYFAIGDPKPATDEHLHKLIILLFARFITDNRLDKLTQK